MVNAEQPSGRGRQQGKDFTLGAEPQFAQIVASGSAFPAALKPHPTKGSAGERNASHGASQYKKIGNADGRKAARTRAFETREQR